MNLVYRGRRAHLENFLLRLPKMLAGKSPDTTRGGVQAVLRRVGMVGLAIIRDAYIVKARGGIDASGMKWTPLSPTTIALRSQSRARRTRWRSIVNGYPGDYSKGKRVAWRQLLGNNWKVELDRLAHASVEILRDTGRLLNSLSPGIRTKDQIFAIEPGAVKIGTNVEYAKRHHNGEQYLPRRPLWPEWEHWPQAWKDQIYNAVKDGIADMIVRWIALGERR